MSNPRATGAVHTYLHTGAQVGVMVEVGCGREATLQSRQFQDLCKDICLQVCSTAPLALSREGLDPELVQNERNYHMRHAADVSLSGKGLGERVERKMEWWISEVCLLEQGFVKDPDKTIRRLLEEVSATLGETIVIRRFARFQVGEGGNKT